MILEKIVEQKKTDLEVEEKQFPLARLKEEARKQPGPKSLTKVLKADQGTKIIAEIKKASPSLGIIRHEGFDPACLAKIYEENGAKAISVITESHFFLGKLSFLKAVKEITSLPILRKDFLWEDYQVYQSRAFGADVILLIAAILKPLRLKELLHLTRDLGMEALVEVHNEKELEMVLTAGAEIIGINNRNLKTFQVSLDVTRRLVPTIPEKKIVISESGIRNRQDVLDLERCGVTAFLVGETFMRAPDAGKALREMIGLPYKK